MFFPTEVPPLQRRVSLLRIATGQLVRLLAEPGLFRVDHGRLPADARPIGVRYDIDRDEIIIALESDAFPMTSEGCPVPDVSGPWLRRHDVAALHADLSRLFDPTGPARDLESLRGLLDSLQGDANGH